MPPELPGWLARWCAAELGSPPLAVLMAASHLSRVFAVELADGRRIVLKARARLRAAAELPLAVGHLDWEAHNLLWRNGAPVAVLDWDSAAIRPEAAIAGPAAAVFPALGATVAATVAQTGQFLDAYQAARGSAFTPAEVQVAWAAGAWVLAFNARNESVSLADGPYQRHLAAEGAHRLRLAGA